MLYVIVFLIHRRGFTLCNTVMGRCSVTLEFQLVIGTMRIRMVSMYTHTVIILILEEPFISDKYTKRATPPHIKLTW